nr:hypothetical protein [Tanacetum cinerariifolium]
MMDEGGGGDGGIWADPEALGAPEAPNGPAGGGGGGDHGSLTFQELQIAACGLHETCRNRIPTCDGLEIDCTLASTSPAPAWPLEVSSGFDPAWPSEVSSRAYRDSSCLRDPVGADVGAGCADVTGIEIDGLVGALGFLAG